MTAEDFRPNAKTHRPVMFICAMEDPAAAVVGYSEHPAKQIASALLEDIGDWHSAICDLEQTDIPPPVLAALDALHDAVCGWVDWNDLQARRVGSDCPTPGKPTPPRGAA